MKTKIKAIASKIWIYILLLVVMVIVVSMKTDYHMDEIYSYGLANNVGQTSIHPEYAPFTYENTADIFLDYMVVEDGEGLDIGNVWYNQERESSPPFYYLCVHLVSVLAGERFSRWTAASVNLLFMILTLYVFRKILGLFDVKEKEQNLYSLYFILSPAILSIVSFFRMYTMAIFAATWLTYLILKYRNYENLKFYVLMMSASIFAVLTQYYLIFYLFFISLIYGIYLLSKKEWMKCAKYILTMAISGGLTIAIFPAIIDQLFSASRGAEGIENFKKGFDVHWTNLKAYCSIINDQLFGNLFWILLLLALTCLIYGRIKKLFNTSVEKVWDICIAFLPSLGYVLIVSKVAPYNTDRYVMATFAMFILFFLLSVRFVFYKCIDCKESIKKVGIFIICTTILVSIWKDFRWPYLYLSSDSFLEEMDSYSDTDGLCVLDYGWKISGNFNDIIKLDTMTFFQNDISPLEDMQDLKSKDEYILYIINNDSEAIIQQVIDICPKIETYEAIEESSSISIYHLY